MSNPGPKTVLPDTSSAVIDALTLVKLKRMLLFTQEDEQYLVMAGNILADHTDDILHKWYEQILHNNYLAHYFTRNGEPDLEYLQRLRPRFQEWLHSLCTRTENQQWWQFEERIAAQLQLKNVPDNMEPLPLVYLRYLSTFIYPVAEAGRFFLQHHSGYAPHETERMHQAWFKAVSFSVLLWIYPEGKSLPF
ncbi:protoglobin domain-containing protein [Chitinophaga nivalis]|uniref:Protoglobin domain-containing protein n=1 Tax=Chitinophaga nivalis TaxID=2991709 RepID=A0ABT3IUM1_9BACT|nr:protoglobin domain-containing protein [Chitinophaga nivalis]MCW3462660.1 protoglobin domain-containing protein [Chitinophaga nivalis]MCW3487649.1 protoglobin domain-containing protein [Chitinophaga nivalis]